jgi:hypothetical protein
MPSSSKGKKVLKKRERSWRGKLVQRFPYAKFLKLVLYNGWFAFFAGLIALICISVAVVIPKFFRVTPDHMDEVEKRSLLDFMQAQQLRKTALRHSSRGDVEEAVNAWVQSVQQNPGKAATVREFVGFLVDNDNSLQHIGEAVRFGQWLLDLGRTNSTDAVLMGRVYNKYGFPAETLKLLEPIHEELDDSVRIEYVRALFENLQFEEFIAEYYQLSDELKQDSRIVPFYKAYVVAFEPDIDRMNAARSELLAMIENEPTNDFLIRLMFLVGVIKKDTSILEDMLTRLTAINAARPRHHHAFWAVLAESGDPARARQLAETYPNPPYTARGLVSQYETLLELGLYNEADEYGLRHIQKFGYVPQPWFAICNSLVERAQWGKLASVADQMMLDSRMVRYYSYAVFYKGKALFGQNRFTSAVEAFRKIDPKELSGDDSALQIVNDLTSMGYPQESKRILTGMLDNEKWTEKKEFWVSYFLAGWNTRDLQTAMRASSQLYLMDPADRLTAFNYAGCLIAEGKQKREALARSRDILIENPDYVPALINLSLALLLNDEVTEARNILELQLSPTSMAEKFLPSYYLALFQLHYQAGEYRKAAAVFPQIKLDQIYQDQANDLRDRMDQINIKLQN